MTCIWKANCPAEELELDTDDEMIQPNKPLNYDLEVQQDGAEPIGAGDLSLISGLRVCPVPETLRI